MTRIFRKGAYSTPIDHERVRQDWAREDFSFEVFGDPPDQEWNDFTHDSDEYVLVAEGEMRIAVGSESFEAVPGDLVRIPRHTAHSLATLSASGSVWLYGYGCWERDDG